MDRSERVIPESLVFAVAGRLARVVFGAYPASAAGDVAAVRVIAYGEAMTLRRTADIPEVASRRRALRG